MLQFEEIAVYFIAVSETMTSCYLILRLLIVLTTQVKRIQCEGSMLDQRRVQ